ncbi:MAG: PAS domain S-box protein, partial [Bacteroidia bacterium]|nr:PAS domain S-box protein [Bacteroidia bacterium]
MTSKQVLSIIQDLHGNIWLGTYGGGITRFDGTDFYHFSVKHGLNSGTVYLLLADRYGFLWVGTEKGLNRFDIRKNEKTPEISTYSFEEGFTGIETNLNATIEDSKGNLWFGTVDGATMYNPNADIRNDVEPITNITKIKLFYAETDWMAFSDSLTFWSGLPKNLVLHYNKNHLTFKFVGIDHKSPKKVQYQWILEGFDKIWSPLSLKREATYQNIPPGKYTFKVKAFNEDGVGNKNPATFSFTILSPFWKTWWFYSLIVIIVVFLIYIFIKLRLRTILREKKLLEKKVELRTHQLQKEKTIVVQQSEKLEEYNKKLEKLSVVASKTDNAIIITDEKGDFIWVNESFTKIFEYTLEQIIEKSPNICGPDTPSHIINIINECIKNKETVNYLYHASSKSGNKIWVQVTLTPILDTNGNIKNLVAIDTDITELKRIEEEIRQQSEKILIQSQLIEKTNIDLSQKNRQIIDSIKCAERIQNAILPAQDLFKKIFPNHFVFFKPKDIVSGDFYWISQQNDKLFIAVVDCTGHGVPGAFMSMIGVMLLNDIVDKERILNPSEILERLYAGLIRLLKYDDQYEEKRDDGMVISLVCFDTINKQFHIACSYQYVYIINSGKTQIIHGDNIAIGVIPNNNKEIKFTEHIVKLENEATIYMFTDGFYDQFGGPKNQKFMVKRFNSLLDEIQQFNMDRQYEILNSTFKEWKGNNSQ